MMVEKERSLFSWLIATFTVIAGTGYLTYFYVGPSYVWEQWTYLVHTLLGFFLSPVILFFVITHFRRTVGLRRPGVLLLGIFLALIALGVIVTGLYIGIVGQTEKYRFIFDVHVWLSTGAALLVIMHVMLYRLFLPKTRQEPKQGLFSIRRATLNQLGIQFSVTIALVGLATLTYASRSSTFKDEAAITPYELNYGEHPFRPSQTETSTGGFLDVKRLGRSPDCGVCHDEIFNEWKSSLHAKAASDKAYQTNINLLAKNKGMSATRYCEGCHAPVALLSGQLATGGKLDTDGHLHEGVSCMSCHGIERVLNTNGVASYLFKPSISYLFAGEDHPLAKKLHNYIVRLQPAQHRKDLAQAPLSTPEICATCHAQFMDKDINSWGWVKMQDDYVAWLNSPYSKQSKQTFSGTTMQRCQDCHFPLVGGGDPSADSNGMFRSHRALGANTAIPFIDGDMEHVKLTQEFLQSNKVRVNIDRPTRPASVRSNKHVSPGAARIDETPGYFYLGEEVSLNVVVTNVGVGHDFPGGTTDINEVWIHVIVTDAQNRLVYQSGAVDGTGEVDSKAHFYRTIPVDRNGEHVWRHDLFRMVGDSYKKVVEAGNSDIVNYKFKIPSWVKGQLNANAIVRYRKFTNRYAKWALKDENIVLPIVDVATDSLRIPVREKLEAQGL